MKLKQTIQSQGLYEALNELQKHANNDTLPLPRQELYAAQLKFLLKAAHAKNIEDLKDNSLADKNLKQEIQQQLIAAIGSPSLLNKLEKTLNNKIDDKTLEAFVKQHESEADATGSLFTKAIALNLEGDIKRHFQDTQSSFEKTIADQGVISSITTDVDFLTKTFHRGEELYLTQACYACHRIAGFSRGGVGPELTMIGKGYPWYLKRKLVWPQGDLKTSTMPNYHLDAEELEPLMAFMLAQNGENRAISATAYKKAIQEWEAGKKTSWEKPIEPTKIHDLRYAMIVFATQGCAACHRLKGFESDVGYRVEKETSEHLDFETRYRESEWFRHLFPEMATGSQIVKAVESHGDEIDAHIVDNVRHGSILEEIERLFPENIVSFYSNFRYAFRAKNHELQTLATTESDPLKKSHYLSKLEQWKKRIHRILMIYIQEYGLGRLVGPRPNWSGIYRSDEWLMEHFHKPTAHVAKSIMPVFPFDDTKFYALTYMLDVLAKRNRDEIQSIWEHRGFNPELAYQTYCLQCHGENMQGNGPVAEWIYPIPKNLRNADFLRNYTKERVNFSITHGVKGTPMPPWGEVATDKSSKEGLPVLTQEEVHQLTDWLFSSLPGGTIIRGTEDVPKWQYTPEDVLKDLQREGQKLKSGIPKPSSEKTDLSPKVEDHLGLNPIDASCYYVSLNPTINFISPNASSEDLGVDAIFNVIKNPPSYPDKYSYYIKKKYYTEENITQGKTFFELNCAVCHGTEADGFGARAEVMQDAKPRMLVNLDWLQMRDDLRLLRSIKFGVPGTSMTPWGDLTSSLQRLQLVIFIRSLSEENSLREMLQMQIYKVFDRTDMLIEKARSQEYSPIKQLQQQLNEIRSKQTRLFEEVQMGKDKTQEAVAVYQEQLSLAEQLKRHQEVDQALIKLKNALNEEKRIFVNLGNALLNAKVSENIFQKFLRLIELNSERFLEKNGFLQLVEEDIKKNQAELLRSEMIKEIDQQLEEIRNQQTVDQGKILSAEVKNELSQLSANYNSYQKLKIELLRELNQASKQREKERKYFAEYQNKMEAL